MSVRACKIAFVTLVVLASASLAFGQTTGFIRGKVVGRDGEGLKGAMVRIERKDIRGHYKVITGKKGDYYHGGLPLGIYDVTLEVEGKVVDRVQGLRVRMETDPVNFDLRKLAARRQRQQSGQANEEELQSLTEEERNQYEGAIKKRQEQLSKNKKLNESFNTGMQAIQTKDYQTAVTSLSQAAEIDGTQPVVWANLANAKSQLALSKTGDQRTTLVDESIAAYRKAVELSPTEGAYHNNLGLALAKKGDMEGGAVSLAKAAELDPINGGKYYFNLGAIMINTGRGQAAIDAFKKATEIDPSYANAYFQLGTALVGAAQIGEDGSVKPVPGTIEAFQKYIELEPSGPFAASSQQMIQSLQGSVQTQYEDPNKKRKKRKKN